MKRKTGCFPFIFIMFACTNALAIEIDDKALDFKLTIPVGFKSFPQGMSRPNAIYSYARYLPDGTPTIIIGIERMHGVIGKKPLTEDWWEEVRKALPPGSVLRKYKEQWRGFQLDGMEAVIAQSGVTLVEKLVQIPLLHEGIQIIVIGPEASSQEISQVMRQLLISLQGETNW